MKVMTVDDSATIRRIIRGTIEMLGYEAVEAASGMEAMDKLQTDPDAIGLVLLDWNMPRMTGLDVLKAIKADIKLKHIPVMMVTTEGEKMKIVTAVQAGASNYLIKPFTQAEMAAKIMECLGTGA